MEKLNLNREKGLSPELLKKYRRLADVLHPDHGGDYQAWHELQAARAEAENGDSKALLGMYEQQAAKDSPGAIYDKRGRKTKTNAGKGKNIDVIE